MTFAELTEQILAFRDARDWAQFHKPKDMAAAVAIEAAELQALIQAEGGDFDLAPWDWSYYSERLRAQKYAFDESELKPYFELDNVLSRGVFHAAEQLYGITFSLREDLPVYHETVRVWEVRNADDSVLA